MQAEAFANKYGKGKFEFSSAGNKPAEKFNPVVVKVKIEKELLKNPAHDRNQRLLSFNLKS
jgi:hypothetical protein